MKDTSKTLSRAERKNHEYSRREVEKCKNVHQIEAYAYAHLVKGFSEINVEDFDDTDLNMLITFNSTINSDDLPPCPWPKLSEDQYIELYEYLRSPSPWIARAADTLGSDRFRALVLKAVDATRSNVEAANSCDDSGPWNTNNDYNTEYFYTELEQPAPKNLVYKEMQKHYPRYAEKFILPDECHDWSHDHDWLTDESESVKITAAHACSPINNNNPRTSASFVPHRQTGGSNADGDGDGDGEPPRSFRAPTPPFHHGLNSLTHSLISGGAQ